VLHSFTVIYHIIILPLVHATHVNRWKKSNHAINNPHDTTQNPTSEEIIHIIKKEVLKDKEILAASFDYTNTARKINSTPI
jgi:hypothetical protein